MNGNGLSVPAHIARRTDERFYAPAVELSSRDLAFGPGDEERGHAFEAAVIPPYFPRRDARAIPGCAPRHQDRSMGLMYSLVRQPREEILSVAYPLPRLVKVT
jgi:hypothetical protein